MNAVITAKVRQGEACVRCSKYLVEFNVTKSAVGMNERYSLFLIKTHTPDTSFVKA